MNNEDSFDPTQKLKSSPVPILFVSFNKEDNNCIYYGDKYAGALFCYNQKYVYHVILLIWTCIYSELVNIK